MTFKYLPMFNGFFGMKPKALPTIVAEDEGGGITTLDVVTDTDEIEIDVKKHHDHDHDKCCHTPTIAVVGKLFSFCDDKKKAEKFEEAIRYYYEKYPYVLIKYDKKYVSKCTVKYCVWFSLLELKKAFELEAKLQKKYRRLLMYY